MASSTNDTKAAHGASAVPTLRRYWILTQPRVASNLFMRMLNLVEQPGIYQESAANGVKPDKTEVNSYFFAPAIFKYKISDHHQLANKPVTDYTDEERNGLMQSYEESFAKLQSYLHRAESKGEIPCVKEHYRWFVEPTEHARVAFNLHDPNEAPWTIPESGSIRSPLNNTLFSDEFLKTWSPTFLIRSPVLSFPSLLRTRPEEFGRSIETLHKEWRVATSKPLYDFYVENLSDAQAKVTIDGREVRFPIVLDADDIMTDPELVKFYASILGMDVSKLKFSWPVTTQEEKEQLMPVVLKMLKTLHGSGGIVQGKTSKGLDIATEAEKWKAEFGEENAIELEKIVRANMPDYEYMLARRLQL